MISILYIKFSPRYSISRMCREILEYDYLTSCFSQLWISWIFAIFRIPK